MCRLLSWQVWLGRGCSSGIGIRVCVGPGVGGQAIVVGVFVSGSPPLPPPLFLRADVGVAQTLG